MQANTRKLAVITLALLCAAPILAHSSWADGSFAIQAQGPSTGDAPLPHDIRLDVVPGGTALSAAILEAAERHMASNGVTVSQSADTVLEIRLNSASSRATVEFNRLRIFGKGGSESSQSFGVVADLQSPSNRKIPVASINMILYQSGRAPIWSGSAFRIEDRPHERPLTISGWIDLSDALLNHVGETVAP